jgi:hypothetical protein
MPASRSLLQKDVIYFTSAGQQALHRPLDYLPVDHFGHEEMKVR